MEKKLEYDKIKFTDWSKHTVLSQRQLSQLINEKILRAKIHSMAMTKPKQKLG